MRSRLLTMLVPLAGLLWGTSGTLAGTLDKVKERGTIAIGLKSDSKPWGFLAPTGQLIGLEVDLAQDVADRLGVKLEPIIVQSSNRIQFLDQGKIDLIIATMYDTPERRRAIDMVEPHYSSAATNVLASKQSRLTTWDQLKGKKVCGQQGSVYNKWIAQKYGADVLALPTVEEDYAALRAGNCVGFVYNDVLIKMALEDQNLWAGYEMPFASEDRQYHSIGVRKGETKDVFGEKIALIVADWHKSGRLIELSKKWGLPEDQFLLEQHNKFKATQ